MLKRSVATATAVNSTNSTESVAVTLLPAPLPNDPSCIVVSHTLIDGFLNFTAGTSTTAIVVRCRRTGLAGTQVGPSLTHVMAAGNTASIAFSWDDNPLQAQPPGEGQIYVITVQQTGGTAVGTTNYLVATVTIS